MKSLLQRVLTVFAWTIFDVAWSYNLASRPGETKKLLPTPLPNPMESSFFGYSLSISNNG